MYNIFTEEFYSFYPSRIFLKKVKKNFKSVTIKRVIKKKKSMQIGYKS